jgi:hypothetical protein
MRKLFRLTRPGAFAFAFLLYPQLSSSKNYYFSSSSGDDSRTGIQAQNASTPWKTLQKLTGLYVNLLPGDSILFRKGDVWVGSTLDPRCNGIIFSSYGSGDLPIIDGDKNLALSIASTYQKNITIDNISFKRSGARDIVALLGNAWSQTYPGLTHSKVTRCSFAGGLTIQGSYNLFKENTIDGATNDGNGNGIWEHHEYSHHNRYAGNNISNFTLRGIWSMIWTHDSVFEDNVIHDCKLCGIDLDGAFYVVYGHAIRNNKIYNIATDAIELENAFDCTISGNYMYGGGHAYIYAINYEKCEIMDGHGATNGLGAILNTTISGNVMIGGGIDYASVAIGIHKAGGINVYNNSIYNFKSRFFDLDYSSPSEVPMIKLVNNVFSTIETPSWYAMINFSTNDLNILAEDDYNCFYNNGRNDIYSERGTHAQRTLDQYKTSTGKGTHSISVNPLFVSTSNLHLRESSPCVNTGKNVGLPFIGKAPDMGAYEFFCTSEATPVILIPTYIDASNSNQWVSLQNADGVKVADIKANGNALGTIQAFSYIHEGPVREDNQGRLFLNRDVTITTENAPSATTPINLRLYISKDEFESLASASNSQGESSGVKKISDVTVLKSNVNVCGEISDEPTSNLSSTNEQQGADFVLTTNVNSLATFYISSKLSAPLPVKLISFTATAENQSNILHWQTAGEENFSHYLIERSFNGKDFTTIGKVDGANQNSYAYADLSFSNYNAKFFYYRLKMVDKDGTFSLSRMVSLSANGSAAIAKIYPNPAKNLLMVNAEDASEINWQIVDNTGRPSLSGKSGDPHFEVKISDLATGTYFLNLKSKSSDSTLKFLKD